MDVETFVSNLNVVEKATLTHGKGAWHTHSICGLPSIMMTDGPHGLRKQADTNKGINDSNLATCFPTASAVATSWNRENARAIADAIATEAIAEDVSVVLGPGLNIKRSPLCGRNFEYFSEDPYLAGELGASYVSAMQAKGVGCSLKHFAVNSQETRRMTMDAIVDERALREIYLAAFEKVVKSAHPYTVMAAYNKVNGVSCTMNKRLLTDILRNDWGFEGLVMSDWGASYDMAKAYSAGMDLEMPDGGHFHEQRTIKAVERGELSEAHLNRAATKVVELVNKCSTGKDKQIVDYAKHHALCRRIAADSAVLLKNNGILPLNKNRHVLIVGELAEKPRFQGAGSSHVNASCKSFLQVLDDNGIKYTYAKGYSISGDSVNPAWEKQASSLALKSDTVLFFGGLTDDFEGEGYDRTTLEIPSCQQSLLAKLAQCNPNIVFVAFGGSPFVMPWLDNVKALLNMYLGGEAVTEAVYDLVFGNVSPSGRLAESYPHKLTDTPCYNYFACDGNVDEHRESIFVGYRYYNTYGIPVQFPFGYGLSYSHFAYSNLTVCKASGGYDVTVTVSNVGAVDASEVVELYVDNFDCGYMRPKRQLVGFEKVFVASGQSLDVTVHLDSRAFSIYADGAFRVVAGEYVISVCKDVETVLLSCNIQVEGEQLSGQDRECYPSYFVQPTGNNGWQIDEEEFYALANAAKRDVTPLKRGQYTLFNTLGDLSQNVWQVRALLRAIKKMAINNSPSKSFSSPVAQMIYRGALETPLISLMSVGGVPTKYVMYLLYHSNRQHFKAIKALFGKYKIDN
ncbi:MAG: glycoside hydrolase family 3 C-terminal domain-containing protein [Clostridiales bacterium]|nr:glycoside hydrolase family 3 C-terminal domain-containing protein [Clostridiales bacterium]